MANEQFSLCWDNFHKSMSSAMNSLLTSEDLVDVTLAIEGQYLKAHKFILSACSPYFRTLFSMNPCKHPIIFMKDVSYIVMSDLLTFMYQGEVQVSKENLATFISTAEALQIKGLTGDNKNVEDVMHDFKMKRPAPIEELPTKTTKQQFVENPAKKTKLSSASEKRETITSPPVETTMEIKPEFFSGTNITNDYVDIKSENFDSNLDEEVNDINFDINQVTDYIENRMCGKDYSMEQETQAGTSGDGMVDSQDSYDEKQRTTRSHKITGRIFDAEMFFGTSKLEQQFISENLGERSKHLRPPRCLLDMSKLQTRHPKKKRCDFCPRRKDRKSQYFCVNCKKTICLQHALYICVNCVPNQNC